MAVIETAEKRLRVLLQGYETCVVEFKPDGANSHEGSKRLGLHIDVLHLPNSRVALLLTSPEDAIYQDVDTGTLVLFDEPNGADEALLSLPHGGQLRLRRYCIAGQPGD